MKKKIIIPIISLIILALAADIGAAVYLFNTTIVRKYASGGRAQSFTGVNWENYSGIQEEMNRVLSKSKTAQYQIESYDGTSLYGQYYSGSAGAEDSYIKRVALCFHGYTSQAGGNSSAAAMYFLNNGFDALLPDARAHGQSGGEYIGFGCLDRLDGLEWIKFIQNMYPEENEENRLEIYLYGASMGGATVCMMSGLELPSCVKGIISDCAFTSPEGIFKNILADKYHLPPKPILFTANLLCESAAGYSLDECSSAEAVKNARVPILFVHGSADSFIPVGMCREIYENCASRKDMLIIEGAAHIESYYKARDEYEQKITEFFGL